MSELSRWDKFKLECAITAQFNDHFNCRKCLEKHSDQKEWRTNTKGCYHNLKEPLAVMEDGTKVRMCLGRMYDYADVDLISQYHKFKDHNILPEEGHINKQNAKTIEAFLFIQSEITKNEILKMKERNGK